MAATPRSPVTLNAAGRRLWKSVCTKFDLPEHERVILAECCRTVDTIDELVDIAKADGLLIESSQGRKTHPALVEARQQRLVLAKLLAVLGIPEIPEEDGA